MGSILGVYRNYLEIGFVFLAGALQGVHRKYFGGVKGSSRLSVLLFPQISTERTMVRLSKGLFLLSCEAAGV